MESTASYLEDTTSKLSLDGGGRREVSSLIVGVVAVNLGMVTVSELTSSGLIERRGERRRGERGWGEGTVTLVSLMVGEVRFLGIVSLSRGVEGRRSREDSLVVSSSSTSSVSGDSFCFLANDGGKRVSLSAHGFGGEGNFSSIFILLRGE